MSTSDLSLNAYIEGPEEPSGPGGPLVFSIFGSDGSKAPSLIDFRLLLAPTFFYLHALVGIYKLYPRYTPWPKMDFCTKLFPGPGKEKFVLFVQLLSFLFMLLSLSSC